MSSDATADQSFGYTRLSNVWIDVSQSDYQVGIDVLAGAYVYNSNLQFMCGYGTRANSVCLRTASNMDRNFYSVTGESHFSGCTAPACPAAVHVNSPGKIWGWGHFDIANTNPLPGSPTVIINP